jgi:hypothetical protein
METKRSVRVDDGSKTHSVKELCGLQQPTFMTQHGSDSYRVRACSEVDDGDDGGSVRESMVNQVG